METAPTYILLKEDEHYHYIEDRTEITVTKKIRKGEIAQESIVLIPYTTFWALLESYNSQIGKDILKFNISILKN